MAAFAGLRREGGAGAKMAEVTAEVPPGADQADSDILGAMTFDGGAGAGGLFGFVHQHGAWIDWRAGDAIRS